MYEDHKKKKNGDDIYSPVLSIVSIPSLQLFWRLKAPIRSRTEAPIRSRTEGFLSLRPLTQVLAFE